MGDEIPWQIVVMWQGSKCLRQGIGIEKRAKQLNSSSDKVYEIKLVGIQWKKV